MSSDKKILLDSNVVINAALLPASFAGHAAALAREYGSQFYVGEGALRETREKLLHWAPNEAVRARAASRVDAFLRWVAAEEVAGDDSAPVPESIPHSDRHVYYAARQVGATVLTSDAGFWLGCRDWGIPVLLPLELIRRWDGFSLQTTLFGVTPTQAAGSLFARVYPGEWAGVVTSGRFTVAHLPGGFWLYYDAAQAAWVAEVAGLAKPLVQSARLLSLEMQTVCLSWLYDAKKPKIQLWVAGVVHPVTESLATPLDFRASGTPTVGCFGVGQHCWNGHIYYCITNDKPVGKDSWKDYQRHCDLAPNPYDADRAAAAVRRLVN